ncbi:MAG TPA: hypothetical protein VM695_04605 [Phycisphaerae bacterium]|nr:hypothetical protein [Phycisphaerae bacterium]
MSDEERRAMHGAQRQEWMPPRSGARVLCPGGAAGERVITPPDGSMTVIIRTQGEDDR